MTDPTALENLRNGLQILAGMRTLLAFPLTPLSPAELARLRQDMMAAEARFTAAMNQLQEGQK